MIALNILDVNFDIGLMQKKVMLVMYTSKNIMSIKGFRTFLYIDLLGIIAN